MKEYFTLLAQYNLWADQLICSRIDKLDTRDLDKSLASSFPSIRKTLGHMFDAERIWLSRLNGKSLDHWPSSKIDLLTTTHLLDESKGVLSYVELINQQEINSLCTYSNSSGKEFSHKVSGVLMHLFNHATYHRGQLISMLRQLGEEDLPATDLIVYLRETTE